MKDNLTALEILNIIGDLSKRKDYSLDDSFNEGIDFAMELLEEKLFTE